MAKPILTVGPSPHIRSGVCMTRYHYLQVAALAPAMLAAVVLHGLDAVLIFLVAAVSAVLVEYLAQHFMRQPKQALNGHALLLGLAFAMLMPPSVPLWLVAFGIALSVVVAKQIFGGLGCYPFHPAMIGYLMMLLSWPHLLAPIGDVSLGTACPYAMAAGGLLLFAFKRSAWRIPVAFLAGVFVGGLIFHAVYPGTVAPAVQQLLTGNVMLAAFFLMPDDTSSPANFLPMLLYGFIGGMLLILIRVYGIWMEAVPFAVLLSNIINPLLDRIKPKPIAMEKTHA